MTNYLGAFLPPIALDSLFSTQGIMVMLLVAYAGAMWMFLSSAPKVYTVMVSDLQNAQRFYEGLLEAFLLLMCLYIIITTNRTGNGS